MGFEAIRSESAFHTSVFAESIEQLYTAITLWCLCVLAQVQEQERTGTGTQAIMTAISNLSAAVKRAEGQLRLDIGDDLSDVDEEVM